MTDTTNPVTTATLDQQIAALTAQRDAIATDETIAGHFTHTDGAQVVDDHSLNQAVLRSVGGAMEAKIMADPKAAAVGLTTAEVDLVAKVKANLDAGDYVAAACDCAMLSARAALTKL